MNKSFRADEEILAGLQSGGPDALKKAAWDQTIENYQGELEELVRVLSGGEDFFVSDIIKRVWIEATDAIGEVDGDLRHFLHSIVRNQCGESYSGHRSGNRRIPFAAGVQDAQDEPNIDAEGHPVQIESFELNSEHMEVIR